MVKINYHFTPILIQILLIGIGKNMINHFKTKINVLLMTLFISQAFAQQSLNFNDQNYSYHIIIHIDKKNEPPVQCSVKSMTVIRKSDKKVIQTIYPDNSYNCFDNFHIKDSNVAVFMLDDINFDGYNDFMIIESFPVIPGYCKTYNFWIFNKLKQQFQQDTLIGFLSDPLIDHNSRLIKTISCGCCGDEISGIYKWENGVLVLIEETQSGQYFDFSKDRIITRKLINGKMKIVKDTLVNF